MKQPAFLLVLTISLVLSAFAQRRTVGRNQGLTVTVAPMSAQTCASIQQTTHCEKMVSILLTSSDPMARMFRVEVHYFSAEGTPRQEDAVVIAAPFQDGAMAMIPLMNSGPAPVWATAEALQGDGTPVDAAR